MTVGENTRIKACWRLVAGCSFAVAVNTEDLAADFGRALWAWTVVVVTRGHVQEAITWAETDTATIVRTWATEGVVGFLGLVADIVDDFNKIGHRRQ